MDGQIRAAAATTLRLLGFPGPVEEHSVANGGDTARAALRFLLAPLGAAPDAADDAVNVAARVRAVLEVSVRVEDVAAASGRGYERLLLALGDRALANAIDGAMPRPALPVVAPGVWTTLAAQHAAVQHAAVQHADGRAHVGTASVELPQRLAALHTRPTLSASTGLVHFLQHVHLSLLGARHAVASQLSGSVLKLSATLRTARAAQSVGGEPVGGEHVGGERADDERVVDEDEGDEGEEDEGDEGEEDEGDKDKDADEDEDDIATPTTDAPQMMPTPQLTRTASLDDELDMILGTLGPRLPDSTIDSPVRGVTPTGSPRSALKGARSTPLETTVRVSFAPYVAIRHVDILTPVSPNNDNDDDEDADEDGGDDDGEHNDDEDEEEDVDNDGADDDGDDDAEDEDDDDDHHLDSHMDDWTQSSQFTIEDSFNASGGSYNIDDLEDFEDSDDHMEHMYRQLRLQQLGLADRLSDAADADGTGTGAAATGEGSVNKPESLESSPLGSPSFHTLMGIKSTGMGTGTGRLGAMKVVDSLDLLAQKGLGQPDDDFTLLPSPAEVSAALSSSI